MRWLPLLLLCVAAAGGCNRTQSKQVEAKPPEVEVATPVADTIRDFEVFTGRTQSINFVDLRSRVTGYLDKVNFEEGEDVKAGQKLFVLKLESFEADLRRAKATLTQMETQLTYAEQDYQRNLVLRAQGANTADDLQKSQANRDTASSGVQVARAALDISQQNLDWATITAPFSGRISRRLVDPGNDVIADNTILASIAQMDPLYAYFDVDERTLLRIRGMFPEGKVPKEAAQKLPITLGLANEKPDKFHHNGKLLFADNRVDANTGTLRLWGTFSNAERDLYPGLFIRVRMAIGEPKKALFVSEAALGSDQGRKFLYVVDSENKIKRVPVEVGHRKNGRIAIDPEMSELKDDDRVVVTGLQLVRPKQEVVPKVLSEMPRVKDVVESKLNVIR
jgi:RND family efflux transporter MFP subunit